MGHRGLKARLDRRERRGHRAHPDLKVLLGRKVLLARRARKGLRDHLDRQDLKALLDR